MPGIVGLVGSKGADVAEAVAAAGRKLLHLDTLTMRAAQFDRVGLAQVWRDQARVERDWCDDGQIAIRIAGHVLEDGASPRRLSARDLLTAYRAHGRIPAEDYDGAFTIVVVDATRRQLLIFSDRVGALPLYYTRHGDRFAFGPEAKTVFATSGRSPRLNAEHVANFMIAGYSIGSNTLFDDVWHLKPATRLTVDLDSLEHRTERYWALRFRPSRAFRKRADAENAIYEVLLRSQRLIVCDDPSAYEVLLSGGLDSRGVMAFADAIGRLPSRTFTWGSSDDIPDSDAFIARRVAEHYGVPHCFVSYDSRTFVDNAVDWVYVSELANDNVGWYAEGQPTLARVYRSNASFSTTGDVAWDSGGYAFSETELRRAVVPAGIPAPMAACLKAGAAARIETAYSAAVTDALGDCESNDLTDRKECLYLNARVARYILSLGYYREHAIEVRRPFLTKAALDLFGSLPQLHRVEKNAYTSMLNRRFPGLMSIPEKSTWSLPDWERDTRVPGPLRDFWMAHTQRDRVEATTLASLLDLDEFEKRRHEYFSNPPAPPEKEPFKAHFPLRDKVLPIVQRHRNLDRISRLVRTGSGFLPRNDFDLMRCVMLVTILEESLDRFGSATTR